MDLTNNHSTNYAIQFQQVIIMIWFAYFAMVGVALFMPTKIQLAMILINLFIPDPIPYLDETLQIIFLIKSLSQNK